MAKYICYTPTTSPRFITEQGILMNEVSILKQIMLEALGGVCLEDGKYSTWEFSDGIKLEYSWVIQYFQEDSKYAKYQEIRAKRLSPTAL